MGDVIGSLLSLSLSLSLAKGLDFLLMQGQRWMYFCNLTQFHRTGKSFRVQPQPPVLPDKGKSLGAFNLGLCTCKRSQHIYCISWWLIAIHEASFTFKPLSEKAKNDKEKGEGEDFNSPQVIVLQYRYFSSYCTGEQDETGHRSIRLQAFTFLTFLLST